MTPPKTCERCDTVTTYQLCDRCSADEYDEDDSGCANCNGEGVVYGCSWDWQCSTYDEGEGTCLCERPCDWCRPSKPNPELQQVREDLLKAAGDEGGAA